MKSNTIKTNLTLGVISAAFLGLSSNSFAFKSSHNFGFETDTFELSKDTSLYSQNDTIYTVVGNKDTTNKYLDATFVHKTVAKDTIIGNKVVFTWKTNNLNEKYCFQISIDSTFKTVALEVCDLEKGYIDFDEEQFLNVLKSDSTNVNKRSNQSSINVYWRIGVNVGDIGSMWLDPNLYDIAVVDLSVTGIENLNSIDLTISPNPIVESFSIHGVENIESVSILNLSGALVKTFGPQLKYSVSDLSTGMYILEVKTSKSASKNRIMIK